MKSSITIDFSAGIFDGDHGYHWQVRPSADSPDSHIDLVYVEAGRDDQRMTFSNEVARAVAEALVKTIELNYKPITPADIMRAHKLR